MTKRDLFEIHISVQEDQQFLLWNFAQYNKIKYIYACAKYGTSKNQLMISKWKTGSKVDAIEKAQNIANDMEKNWGLTIIRIKIESMALSPLVQEETSLDNYFEFHVKVGLQGPEKDSYNKLEQVCNKHSASISINTFSNEKSPIVTLRIAGKLGVDGAFIKKDLLFKDMKKLDCITIHDKIQQEYCIYDTNKSMDDGWLITVDE